jgi:hypothetical protein
MSYLKLALAALQSTTSASDASSHTSATETPQVSGISISICTRCGGEIFLRTSFGK